MAFFATIKKLLKRNDGATAIEYALIAAGIAMVMIPALNHVGTNLSTKFDQVATSVAGEEDDGLGIDECDPGGYVLCP